MSYGGETVNRGHELMDTAVGLHGTAIVVVYAHSRSGVCLALYKSLCGVILNT